MSTNRSSMEQNNHIIQDQCGMASIICVEGKVPEVDKDREMPVRCGMVSLRSQK